MNAGKHTFQRLSIIMLVVLLTACGKSTTETPIPSTTIQVLNITENDIEIGQITQTKSFNQCEADGPISATIQFSESSGQTSQKALTLSGTSGIQVGLEKVAEIKLEGAVEEHFSVTRDESHGTSESISFQVPARTRQEYTIIWKEIRRTGTIEYLENGENKYINFSYRTGVEFESSSVRNIDCSLPTETPVPTFTPPPTVTEPATTKEPTATPKPEPIAIAEGCIDSQTWTPISSSEENFSNVTTRTNGCYSMESLGMFADSLGILHVKLAEQRTPLSSGIYTPVKNNSTIEFNLHVNYMYIVYNDNPLTVNFVIAPADDLAVKRNSTRFNLTVLNPGSEPVIHYFLADAGENTGTRLGTQHYEYGHDYDIRFELSGNVMKIYINNYKLQEDLFIPTGQKVFYIGYDLPIISSADVEIRDLTIDGVRK